MINKQDVLNLIKDMKSRISNDLYSEADETVLDILLNKIEGMEEATDTNVGGKWIPCSERLPNLEKFEPLLVTDDKGWVWCDMRFGYADDDDTEPCFHKWDDEYWYCFKPNVIAWLPLPEPFREVKQ